MEGAEIGGKSETAEPAPEREQKPTETESPLERTPSNCGFANLAEELDARRASREAAQGNGATNEQPSETGKPDKQTAELDDDAIKEQIDPFAPDLSKTEGRKETFERTVRDSDADWTEGVDRLEDIPTGETLSEGDDGERSKGDGFRKALYSGYGNAKKSVEQNADLAADLFGPRPSGHAETRADSGPRMADPHHSGVDAGTAASSLLALGIVGAELLRWGRGKIRDWETRDASDG
ncbi:hypothetical protein [Actinomadura chibensis]|uniref:Uncharacterized protein n=1 Tax=Actinomadura chibensis TaxID=392828 RepID=A0A5D0NXH9_9ACTN|nr:hypothetical protein [Actinomadura chibensis]TYB48691.1 hypothetical protein FXF69_05815 [Actinomadura chibensis]